MKSLLTGNEAIARGVYEAGVKLAAAYPGTPSTEILEELAQHKDVMHVEWSPNEKVGVEVGLGSSIAGIRSFGAMKHVGVNVAADPIFTSAYTGVNAGYVFVGADDPNMFSSQNEQDNRHYAEHAKLPMIEPGDSQECLDFVKKAYEISEEFKIPVFVRTVTRVAHSKSLVEIGEREEVSVIEYKKDPSRFVATPGNAYKNHPILEQKLKDLEEYSYNSDLNEVEINGSEVGVITSSIAYYYAKDAFPEDTSFLKLGMTFPISEKLVKEFAEKVDKIYIIEELDPYLEKHIKAMGIDCIGKEIIPLCYELNAEIIKEAVFGEKVENKKLDIQPASRPPALCPGCPHRGFFYSIGKLNKKNKGKFVVSGDIGCYTLGAAPPLAMMDSCICMGSGFSVGAGMAHAFEISGQDKKVFGVLGDSTFFHSGMTGAVEIMYNNANMIPVVLDNHITAMTGHQDNPSTGYNLEGEVAEVVSIENVLKAIGFKNVILVDPQHLHKMEAALEEALDAEERTAIIARRACVLIKRNRKKFGRCQVDRETCIGCKSCLGVGCPAVSFVDGKSSIDETLCVGCTVCAQVCPVQAIRRVKEDK